MNRPLVVFGVACVAVAAACDTPTPTLSKPDAPKVYEFRIGGPAVGLPRGTVRFQYPRTAADVTRESLTVVLQGLDSLTTGFYTAWVGDSLGVSFKRVAGGLSYVRTDTTFNSDGGPVGTPTTVQLGAVSAFASGGPNRTFTWGFARPTAGLVAADSIQHFLITIESSASATTPSATLRPVWARRGDGTAAAAAPAVAARTSTILFGNYAPLAVDQYSFVGSARGRAAFQERLLMMDDSSMSRPPRGYYYAFYALKRVPVQTTGWDTVYLGRQTSPYPRRNLSQYDADITNTDPLVVTDIPWAIGAGSLRISADTFPGLLNPGGVDAPAACNLYGCPFLAYTEVWLTLQSKSGPEGRMGGVRVLLGLIPAVITNGKY